MQAKRVQGGGPTIPYTPETAKLAGDVIEIGDNLVGVVVTEIAAGELGALELGGIWAFKKVTGAAAQGNDFYWDNDGNPAVGTAGSGAATADWLAGKFLGYVAQDADADDEYVNIVRVFGSPLVGESLP